LPEGINFKHKEKIMTSSKEILLNPVGETDPLEIPLAPRLPDLSGRVLGLLDNMKVNCELFLDRLEELLRAKYQIGEVLRRKKFAGAGKEAPPEVLQELAGRCDLVIHAFGD